MPLISVDVLSPAELRPGLAALAAIQIGDIAQKITSAMGGPSDPQQVRIKIRLKKPLSNARKAWMA